MGSLEPHVRQIVNTRRLASWSVQALSKSPSKWTGSDTNGAKLSAFLHDIDRGAASPAFRVLFVFVADPYRLKRIDCRTLAGEPVDRVIDRAAGNNAPIGGIKVSTANGWLAARPSGTEDIYKIYAESFRDVDHLAAILA